MAISSISSAAAVATTVAMPTQATGDLILATVWRNGSTTAPTIPAGWTAVKTQTGTTCWGGVYKKIAASGSETTGTWTSANSVLIDVYRGASDVGVSTSGTGSTTTITYPAATLTVTDGTSWVFRSSGNKTATNTITNVPTGYTARGGTAGTNGIRGCDTNGGTGTSPTSGTQAISPTAVFVAFTVEILAPPAPPVGTLATFAAAATAGAGNHTVSAGSDRALIWLIGTSGTVTSVSYGGQAMTLLAHIAGSSFFAAYDWYAYGLLSPAVGTNTFTIGGGASPVFGGTLSYTGVASFGDTDANGAGGALSVTSALGDSAIAFTGVLDSGKLWRISGSVSEGWGSSAVSWTNANIAVNIVGGTQSSPIPTNLFFDMF